MPEQREMSARDAAAPTTIAPTAPTIHVRRDFSSRPERVFDAFLDPRTIHAWFGRRRRDLLRVDLQPHVGGALEVAIRRGGDELHAHGTVRELERPRRLAFTWAVPTERFPESVITVELSPREQGGTRVNLTHVIDPSWADRDDLIEAAWISMLDALADVLGYPACDDPAIDEP